MAQEDALTAAIQACVANADELLRGAHCLADQGLARLAYNLGVLALEEVGKTTILKMQLVAQRRGREVPPSISNAVDDHVRKLFWARWGPSMGLELITREQIERNIGLAQRLHDRRVRGLYVDSDDRGLWVPMHSISPAEAATLLHFAEACIEMARPASLEPSDAGDSEADERQEWFFNATDDPERRKLIMGAKSMAKLKELGSVPAWVTWLKETLEENEAEARAAVDRELQRQPDQPAQAKPKWRTTIRLYSASHSIRQRPLNQVNEGLAWIKFRAVSGKQDQLLVDLDATSDLTLDDVWKSSLALSRRLVMALNVATIGYFWFHEPLDHDPKQSGRFYERLADLHSGLEIRAQRNPPFRLEFGSRRRVLDQADLNRWVLCFGSLLRYRKSPELDICERYLDGLAMIGKSDAHMAFEIQAVVAFHLALKTAMKHHGAWGDEAFGVALKRFAADALTVVDEPHFDRLIEVGESVNTGRGVPHAMNMNDVGVMKTLCDVYLLRTFEKLGPGDPGDEGNQD